MTDDIRLREVADDDLPIFFDHQLHPAANRMAAFTPRDPSDRQAFSERWSRLRADDTVLIRTVLCEGRVAGSILKYEENGRQEVSYWLGREFWGRGVATRATAAFLDLLTTRPLFARVAKDNVASLRVLEKCGFRITGEDKGFAHARGEEVEEFILKLDAHPSAGGDPS